jgi:predicted small lipoprotein YifL
VRTFGTAGVALLLVAALAGCGGGGAGPFAWPKDAGTTRISGPDKVGKLAAVAIPFAHAADKPAVLLDVRPQHPEDAHGLTIRYAATTGRGMELAGQRGWHPAAWELQPLAGFVIRPHVHAAVVIGAAAAKPGIYLLRGFIVDYRIGSTRYSAPQQLGFGLCVGRPCPSS